jgi:predicted ATPase
VNGAVYRHFSGGGKSTLLAELGRRGHAIVEEPGRRIVQQELQQGGTALPWNNGQAFAHRAIAMALEDRASATALGGGCYSTGAWSMLRLSYSI